MSKAKVQSKVYSPDKMDKQMKKMMSKMPAAAKAMKHGYTT